MWLKAIKNENSLVSNFVRYNENALEMFSLIDRTAWSDRAHAGNRR